MFHDKIKNGAVFIADAHENGINRKNFDTFLQMLEDGKIDAPQLFLMGDMFDFFVGGAKYSKISHLNYIKRLEKIAEKMDTYYFEGNHDFNLGSVFKRLKVIPLKNQPLYMYNQNGSIKFTLAHGDLYTGQLYNLYTKLIRNKILIFILNAIDFGGWISNFISKTQRNKKICRKIDDFKKIISHKAKLYKCCDFIVEGHYHQNRSFDFGDKKYINFASLACESVFYIFDGSGFKQESIKESI